MASGLEVSEQLKCQTWVLKVSIHCEGCKKRVKKVLRRIEGVYKTTIDCQQQKVIVTGNVAVDTLVKKLFKIGKHAELWPEKRPAAQNPTSATAAEEKKNKKKASSCGVPLANLQNTSEKDDTSASDKKEGPQEDFTGDDGDKTCFTDAGKKKGKKSSINSSAAASNGEAEHIKGEREIPPIQEAPNVCHFSAYISQPPAYLVSYKTSPPPAICCDAAYYPMAMQQSSFLYSGHHPLTGPYHIPVMGSSPVSYDLFSVESTDVCSVM